MAKDTLSVLQDTWADLILCDVRMPGMDGVDFARAVRRHPDCRSVKLIAVTGLSEEADATRLGRAGFDAHLVKPLDYDTLRDTLDRIFWMRPKH